MNYRYFTFLTERDTIMWQGRERLLDAGKLDMKKGFLMQGKFEMQRRLSDAGKLDMKKGFLMQGDFEMPRRAFRCRERGLS